MFLLNHLLKLLFLWYCFWIIMNYSKPEFIHFFHCSVLSTYSTFILVILTQSGPTSLLPEWKDYMSAGYMPWPWDHCSECKDRQKEMIKSWSFTENPPKKVIQSPNTATPMGQAFKHLNLRGPYLSKLPQYLIFY